MVNDTTIECVRTGIRSSAFSTCGKLDSRVL